MEIEVEADTPGVSRIHRDRTKRSGEKSRKAKHRSSKYNESADGSRKKEWKPKIFRLLRSSGRWVDSALVQDINGSMTIATGIRTWFRTDMGTPHAQLLTRVVDRLEASF